MMPACVVKAGQAPKSAEAVFLVHDLTNDMIIIVSRPVKYLTHCIASDCLRWNRFLLALRNVYGPGANYHWKSLVSSLKAEVTEN